jgi:hypothetical protein
LWSPLPRWSLHSGWGFESLDRDNGWSEHFEFFSTWTIIKVFSYDQFILRVHPCFSSQ